MMNFIIKTLVIVLLFIAIIFSISAFLDYREDRKFEKEVREMKSDVLDELQFFLEKEFSKKSRK